MQFVSIAIPANEVGGRSFLRAHTSFSSALGGPSALADLRAQGLAGTSTAVQLPNAVRHESTREARYKDGRGCYGDQVDAPGVVASAYKIEMSGVGFVSICVKAHGAASFCAVRANLTGRLPKGSSADRHGPPLVGSAPTNGGWDDLPAANRIRFRASASMICDGASMFFSAARKRTPKRAFQSRASFSVSTQFVQSSLSMTRRCDQDLC
jgi:hypothetical protein